MLSFYLSVLETDDDRRRFAQLYEQHHRKIEQTAMRILKDQQDAEDAVQNTFMQVIKHFEKVYEIPCKNLPFWFISIVKNEALMILRKKKRVVQLEDWDGIVEESEYISDYDELVQLFSRLPETYRAALEMKFLLEFSGKEIALWLGITETAVNTRISRGRVMLKDILEKEGFHV